MCPDFIFIGIPLWCKILPSALSSLPWAYVGQRLCLMSVWGAKRNHCIWPHPTSGKRTCTEVCVFSLRPTSHRVLKSEPASINKVCTHNSCIWILKLSNRRSFLCSLCGIPCQSIAPLLWKQEVGEFQQCHEPFVYVRETCSPPGL